MNRTDSRRGTVHDLLRKKIADASARLARVESARDAARADFEIATAGLIAAEREHVLVLERLAALRQEAEAGA